MTTITEAELETLRLDYQKAGSVPALLENMAREQKARYEQIKEQIEQGPHHPTGDELYDYVLGWLDQDESMLVMKHLGLCGRCLREVIKIRRLEEALTEDALARADGKEVPEWVKAKAHEESL